MVCLVLGAMNIGAFGSLLKLIAIIPVTYWIFDNGKISFPKPIKFASLYVIWIMASYTWTINSAESLNRAITQITFLLMILSVSNMRFNECEISYLKNCLIWSSRITAFVVLLTGSYMEGRIYLKSENGTIREDPNYLCGYFSFAIVYLLLELIQGNIKGKKRTFFILELIIYAYIVFGTGSRGGLFAILISISIVILFSPSCNKQKSNMPKKIIIIIILGVVAYLATLFLDENVLQRFSSDTLRESDGTGRFTLWNEGLKAYNEFPFFRQLIGYGTATAKDLTYIYSFSHHNVMHNMFIENLLEIGIVGMILYVLHIKSFFEVAIKEREIFLFSVLGCMFVLSLSTSIYAFKPYWNIMIFTMCCFNSNRNNDVSSG